jgi:hypothetical protein
LKWGEEEGLGLIKAKEAVRLARVELTSLPLANLNIFPSALNDL